MSELVAGDGFGEVVIHTGFETKGPIVGGDAGGEGDDGSATRGAFEAADLAGSFQAVHVGHLDIHKNEVEGIAVECGESLGATCGGVHLAAKLFEQEAGEPEIDGIILNDQNAEAGRRRGSDFRGRRRLLLRRGGDAEPECGALAGLGGDADFPMEGEDNFATDGEAES